MGISEHKRECTPTLNGSGGPSLLDYRVKGSYSQRLGLDGMTPVA